MHRILVSLSTVFCLSVSVCLAGCVGAPDEEGVEDAEAIESILDDAPESEPQDIQDCIWAACDVTCTTWGWNSRDCNICWNFMYNICQQEEERANKGQ